MSLYELGYCDPEKDKKDFLYEYCSTRRCGAKSSIECFDPIGTRTHRYPVSCEICVRWGVNKVNPALMYVYIFDGNETYYETRWVCSSHFDYVVSDFENKIESYHPAGPCPQCGKPRVRIPRKQKYYQCCNPLPLLHCYICKLHLPSNYFFNDKSRGSGKGSACKSCVVAKNKERKKLIKPGEKDTTRKRHPRVNVGDKIRCNTCWKFLPFDSFHRDKYTKTGRTSKCKTCVCKNTKANYYKQKGREKSAVG